MFFIDGGVTALIGFFCEVGGFYNPVECWGDSRATGGCGHGSGGIRFLPDADSGDVLGARGGFSSCPAFPILFGLDFTTGRISSAAPRLSAATLGSLGRAKPCPLLDFFSPRKVSRLVDGERSV